MTIGGRALTVAVGLALLALGWTIFQPRPAHPRLSAPTSAAFAHPAPVPMSPTAREILAGGGLLDLKVAQRTRLLALDAAWTRQSATSQARLDAAMTEFARFMDEARTSGRTSLQEIRRHSSEISALGADLRERRRLHAQAAAAVLTEWQRRQLGQTTAVSGGSHEN